MILRSTAQDPTDVRPPAAVARRVWVAVSIRVRMMNPMRGDPLNGSAFERQRSADDQEVLDWLWYAVAAMSDKPMKAHPNAKTAADPVQNQGGNHPRPAKEK